MLRYTKKKKKTIIGSQLGLFWSKTKKYSSLSTLNNGATLIQTAGNQGWVSALSDISRDSGNFVFEIVLDSTSHAIAGFSTDTVLTNYANYAGNINNTMSVYLTYGGSVSSATTKNFTTLKSTSIGTCAVGDAVAFAFNMTEGKCYIFKNGVNLGAYFGGLTGKMITPIGSLWDRPSKITGKSKAADFKYAYPGYVGIAD